MTNKTAVTIAILALVVALGGYTFPRYSGNLGGTTNFDSLSLGETLSVTGASTLTGAVTLDGAINSNGASSSFASNIGFAASSTSIILRDVDTGDCFILGYSSTLVGALAFTTTTTPCVD